MAGYSHLLLKITLKRERERSGVVGIYSAVANVGPHGMFKGDALLDDCDLINEYDNHDPNSSFECPRSYP
jgi:hypothetical protein